MAEELKVLNREFVETNLEMEDCIRLMEETLKAVEHKTCVQYLRTAINLPNQNILGIMPSYFEEGYFGAKILSVYPQNSREGYPSHQGQILLFEKEHGQVEAVVDAMSVTKIRTGAVSAAASSCLANPDSDHLALLGSGEQAWSHLEAMLCRFQLKAVTVWDLDLSRAEAFAQAAGERFGVTVRACETAREAVGEADIICTLTPAKTPILEYEWIRPGVHINAVGACTPSSRELASQVVAHSRFFGDNEESVMNESGDFLFPLKEGAVERSHFLGTLGQVLLGQLPGRLSREDITVFEALGMAAEDIAAARYLWRKGV